MKLIWRNLENQQTTSVVVRHVCSGWEKKRRQGKTNGDRRSMMKRLRWYARKGVQTCQHKTSRALLLKLLAWRRKTEEKVNVQLMEKTPGQ